MSAFFQLIIASGAALGILLIWNILLEWRLRRLTKGHSGKSLESHLANIARDYQDLEAFKATMAKEMESMDSRLKTSVRGTGIVRFNPFAGSGDSKPSFAMALISEKGDGIIISTLHARNTVSIFSKNVAGFKTEQELSGEEAQALEKARKSLHT